MKPSLLYRLPLVAFALFSLSGCSSWVKVYSEEQPGVNLSQYYSYNWLENNETTSEDLVPYPLSRHAEDKIRSATNAQMLRYGYQYITNTPDLILHYHVVVENQVYLQNEWNCIYNEAMPQSTCRNVRPTYYREGTLIIDFIDAKTGNQVWRGAAKGTVENYSPAQWDAEIEDAIRDIFKRFPLKPVPQHEAVALDK